jgi:hypothetical protein
MSSRNEIYKVPLLRRIMQIVQGRVTKAQPKTVVGALPEFQYDPLSEPMDTRVLVLHQGEDGGNISCHLEQVDLKKIHHLKHFLTLGGTHRSDNQSNVELGDWMSPSACTVR